MGKWLDFLLDDDGLVAETLRDLSDEDREDEYAKSEEYGDSYMPNQGRRYWHILNVLQKTFRNPIDRVPFLVYTCIRELIKESFYKEE